LIISGYQGIGKSSLAGTNNCIDLESGNFWIDGIRDKNWYKIYCNIANHLSAQGYTVFVSSHEIVRKELEKSKETVYVIFPSTDLKDQWIEKLRNRYKSTGLEKDFKALANAEDRYEENIKELMCGNLQYYQIIDIDYNLKEIIKLLKLEEEKTWKL
jgi:hypothetical protein